MSAASLAVAAGDLAASTTVVVVAAAAFSLVAEVEVEVEAGASFEDEDDEAGADAPSARVNEMANSPASRSPSRAVNAAWVNEV